MLCPKCGRRAFNCSEGHYCPSCHIAEKDKWEVK